MTVYSHCHRPSCYLWDRKADDAWTDLDSLLYQFSAKDIRSKSTLIQFFWVMSSLLGSQPIDV